MFRHRHRYRIARPGAVFVRGIGGGIFPCVRWYCRCGAQDPSIDKLAEELAL